MTTTTSPDVPLPDGAIAVHEWYDPDAAFGAPPVRIGPDTERFFVGTSRRVDLKGGGSVEVTISGIQYGDCRVEREITVNSMHPDEPITARDAHAVAAELVEAADEIDGWAAK